MSSTSGSLPCSASGTWTAADDGGRSACDSHMTAKSNMRVVELTGRGGTEVLRLAKRAVPMPGVDDVLIKVHAAGLNRADLNHRNGYYTPAADQSDLLGLEVAGEIVACG